MAEEYTGDEGDDALAAGMDVLDGTEDWRDGWRGINKTRDYIVQKIAAAVATIWPIGKGGTGSDTAAGARANLAVPETVVTGLKFTSPSFDRIALEAPGVAFSHTLAYVTDIPAAPDLDPYVEKAGDIMTGHLYLPNAIAAVSGYTIAYINSDGRVSKGASSERYKKFITPQDPAALGDVWPELHRFQMRSGDGSWRYGWIAERLAETDALRPFVVYADGGDGQMIPDSIDFIALLQVQAAQMHAEIAELRAIVDELQGGAS